MNKPFSLRIFVADGDPDGLRVVERSNWIGKALMFPRALLPRVKERDELKQTGVYLLIGPREDGEGDLLYIGEGDPVRPRLECHYAHKDFWTHALCFIAAPGQLNKAHVQFLEANLIRMAKAARRVPLDNGNQPMEPSLSEADRADMLVFLENVLGMLPVMGVHAFEKGVQPAAAVTPSLVLRGKGITASGFEASQGFVVRAGSLAVGDTVPSMQQHVRGMYDLRQQLIGNGVMARDGDGYRFSQDYVFTSPSTAAAVVLGRSANGRVEWKDAQGRTLKALQAGEASA
ncbi:GIY-YIG nuclease family protein [Methyloversatilis sp.]|uniref:GIY-YIG nuclease family protein n=1 Tax=Methyloversatilis sp. TaxID=2569862 RepID=UPI002736AF9F|nr:GIY-YIG nuclease family protein [Methyloversatilis sp.]MDP2869516.1 GIY-YIG nuclease family protein [Methyloversatilis sp.]MDP3289787.1 GIY-YIG nuclease family protein [Methyloversatilis sp.]MDP3456077.1 GIY-YIG nuclease family protein [Methyloversatilis sp.]MDP3577330.1 GIY-YIG nuclease family protein [Methyloversatilis sp.]